MDSMSNGEDNKARNDAGEVLDGGLDGFQTAVSSDTPRVSFHLRAEIIDDGDNSTYLDPFQFSRQYSAASRSEGTQSFHSCRESISTRGDDQSTASYHTATMHTATSVTENDFLSCREPSSHNNTTFMDQDHMSYQNDMNSVDDDSFHTCRKFNEQGLRSVLSVDAAAAATTPVPARFNIPLDVVTKSVLSEQPKAGGAEQSQAPPRRVPWLRPLLAFLFLALLSLSIGGAFWMVQHARTTSNSDQSSSSAGSVALPTVPKLAATPAPVPLSQKGGAGASATTTSSSSSLRTSSVAPSPSPEMTVQKAPTIQPTLLDQPTLAPTSAATTTTTTATVIPTVTALPTSTNTAAGTELPTQHPSNRHHNEQMHLRTLLPTPYKKATKGDY
jgi:hypothetical protein